MGENLNTQSLREVRAMRALRRKKARWKFNDEVKEKRVYTLPKILITATVAITVAVISSFLTTAVNSLLLVLLVSIITGVLSEVYRIFVAFLKYGALSVADIPTKKSRAELAQEKLAREIRALEFELGVPPTESLDLPEDLEELARAEAGAQQEQTTSMTPEEIVKTRVLNVIAGREPLEDAPPVSDNVPREGFWRKLVRFLKIRPQFNMVLLFFFVAVIAVIASFFVNQQFTPEVTQTTITKENTVTEKVSLSDEERQAIIDEAVSDALAQAPAPTEQVSEEQINALWSQLNETSDRLNTLTATVEQLQRESNGSTETPGLTSDDLAPLQDELTELRSRLESLESSSTVQNQSEGTTSP